MEIKQFRYSKDNLGYLAHSKNYAMAVDGGAPEEILDFVRNNNLTLKYVTNTHSHMDHTCGNNRLLDGSEAIFLDHKTLLDQGSIFINNEEVKVHNTPGHTHDSVIFHIKNILLTGDTLFIGKVGRCFSGDPKRFLESIKLILTFPQETIIYPGHDYVYEYTDFDKNLEPENKYIDEFLKEFNPGHIFSTLGQELKIDQFLRFNENEIISMLMKRGLNTETELDRWESLLSLM